MTASMKKTAIRVFVSFLLLIAAVFLPVTGWLRLVLFLVPYLLAGGDVLWEAIRNILHGQVFDENFLMSLATVGAFATGEYPEAVFVMLFYQVGELFQKYAVRSSRASISDLMDIRPDYANVDRNGTLEKVDPETVNVGDEIVIKPGERVPLDGEVLSGSSTLDTAALTGESMPRGIQAGDDVVSGCVNLSGVLRVRVTRAFGESTVSRILDLVENATAKKAKTEKFITRFARIYTPAVVGAAALLAVLPPLILGGDWADWIHRALIFLVISCPCALVISVPLSFFGGLGGASKKGVLVKGSSELERLAQAEIVVFDKTGTLTKGVFNVTAVHPDQISEARLLELAVFTERFSDHPIARSLREAYGLELPPDTTTDVEEIAGRGLRAKVQGLTVCAGNDRLMDDIGALWRPCHHVGTIVHVAVDGVYAGHIVISDELKSNAKLAIEKLKACGVRKTVMLTGDAKAVGEHVAAEVGIDEAHAQLLPEDKVREVERLLTERSPKGALVFVGDGINDAPVLARADIGVAMGALGSDAAIEAADVVLMDDDPAKIADAVGIARRTLSIVRQNIVFALGVKAVVLILGALGISGMWEAVFADVGVSVIAILNAMRAMRVSK